MPEDKTISARPLLDKLGVKPHSRVVLIGVHDATFLRLLEERLRRPLDEDVRGNADLIFYFVHTKAELKRLRGLKRFLKKNGAIWVLRPKGSPVLRKEEVLALGRAAGLVDTKVVSFSPGVTAEKFVIPLAAR
jgi:hypothetical protein